MPESLAPGRGEITAMVGQEYAKQNKQPDMDPKDISAHVGMAASASYVFFSDVLPRAIKKYGGIDGEALRQAALETNIPVGGTLLGFGVTFPQPGSDMDGQNGDAFPVMVQYVKRETKIAWPKALQTIDPIMPLPSDSPYAK